MEPLAGLRVLDLSRHLPGPYCTLILADLGAEVIKIEDPAGGDPLRQMPPALDERGGAIFHAFNRGKKSVALDLRTQEGRAAFLALLPGADVVVEGFRPGVLERLGVPWEVMRAQNERLILCSITGFGQTGPDRRRAGHDIGFAARAGVLGITGERHGRQDVWPGVQIADIAGGSLLATISILAALRERDRTGQGRHLDVSMTDGALGLLHMHLASTWGGLPTERGRGPVNGALPCYGVYRTKDGRQMAIGALEPKFWQAFCQAAERPDLVERGYDPEAIAEVEALFASRPFAAWRSIAQSTDCCLEPVWEGDEPTRDEQLRARGLFFDLEDPAAPGGSIPSLRTPLAIGSTAEAPAPGLGAHTRSLLREAGLDEQAIEALLRRS